MLPWWLVVCSTWPRCLENIWMNSICESWPIETALPGSHFSDGESEAHTDFCSLGCLSSESIPRMSIQTSVGILKELQAQSQSSCSDLLRLPKRGPSPLSWPQFLHPESGGNNSQPVGFRELSEAIGCKNISSILQKRRISFNVLIREKT